MLIKKEKADLDSREILLQTAERLFAEHGFEAVTTRMLQQESGVNVAMIAYYFGSKEKLFEAIIGEHIPRTRELLIGFLKYDVSSWEKLSLCIEAYVDKIFLNNTFSKLMYRELSLQQRPTHSQLIADTIMKNWEIINQIITEGQQKNEFKADIDIPMTMASIFGTIIQIVNTPCIAVRALSLENESQVFSDENRLRLKEHLKKMIGAHLLVQ